MGYQVKFIDPDGSVHLKKQVFKTKEGAEKKADWWRKHLRYSIRVVRSRS